MKLSLKLYLINAPAAGALHGLVRFTTNLKATPDELTEPQGQPVSGSTASTTSEITFNFIGWSYTSIVEGGKGESQTPMGGDYGPIEIGVTGWIDTRDVSREYRTEHSVYLYADSTPPASAEVKEDSSGSVVGNLAFSSRWEIE